MSKAWKARPSEVREDREAYAFLSLSCNLGIERKDCMPESHDLLFPPFRLDLGTERLWQGEDELVLRPKTFAVLRYLLEQAGRLVSKEELLNAIWPGTYVSDVVLKGCIRELRHALGDDTKAPRFIETVHRRGYRFIAEVGTQLSALSTQAVSRFPSAPRQPPSLNTGSPAPAPQVVGRERELGQLQGWFEKALGGERQVVCITGEAGIGKTTVVEAFVAKVRIETAVWIGHGQCIEHYGEGEAYLPVLEALSRLCRASDGQRITELLAQYAPTWLVQMPSLLSAADLEGLQLRVLGSTRERMLREMAEAVEVLTAEKPLILVLEDLHWSDHSTLELLASLARRRESARLFVIGTYRPVDVIVREHPLQSIKQELLVHGLCEELALEFLPQEAVAEYLSERFPAQRLPEALVQTIHQRTDGNPLFLVNVVDYLAGQEIFAEGGEKARPDSETVVVGIPESLRQMLEQQITRLSEEEQRLLEVGSIAGAEFTAAAVAAGIEKPLEEAEERCEELVRRGQVLRARGWTEWPDGTVSGRYGFIHALHQEVLYERIPMGRRIHLHRQVGERLETGYGERSGEFAAELAVHFERGRDAKRAVQYLRRAGETALQRYGHREAILHLTRGIELLQALPDTPERAQDELSLQTVLGPALMSFKGYVAPEVEQTYARARELCQQIGDTAQLFPVLWGSFALAVMQGRLGPGSELADQMMRLAQEKHDPDLLLQAHYALGMTCYRLGQLALARQHLEHGLALYDPDKHFSHAFVYGGAEPGVGSHSFLSWVLWYLGYPDQALASGEKAITLAQDLSHPYSLAFALNFTAWVHTLRRERARARQRAEAAMRLAADHGFPQALTLGTILQGWALEEHGATRVAPLQNAITAWQDTRAEDGRPYHLTLLAEVWASAGKTDTALSVVDQALAVVDKNGERIYEAELYRLKGELILNDERGTQNAERQKKTSKKPSVQHSAFITHRSKEAEQCFQRALEIARVQGAKSLELRAVLSLSRLWQHQRKKTAARNILTETAGWFTEGFDTPDVQDARALLAQSG